MSRPGSHRIAAEGIERTFCVGRSRVSVLRGAHVTIDRGELVAVVGVSGAGKSTLLHILGGLDTPDCGRVMIDGEDMYRISEGRRTMLRREKIGFVFQSYHLLPEMDVLENVMLPSMAGKRFAGRHTARERAGELLRAVGLEDRLTHTPLELSGGEQQRVALARALMNDPQFVLADEPTGNLDDATGEQVLGYLFRLVRAHDHSLILVTHDEEIAGSCDRVVRLRDGVLTET